MRLQAGVREALYDPTFAAPVGWGGPQPTLDAELTEHLQAGPYQRSEGHTGYRTRHQTRVGTFTLAALR